MIILLLIKQAHQLYLRTKSKISIGSIVQNFRNSNKILTSPRYKTIEALINSEELPIVMFLTTIRDELQSKMKNINQTDFSASQTSKKILESELENLFQICLEKEKMGWVFESHVQNLVNRRFSGFDSKEVLIYALELLFSRNLEHFFEMNVAKGVKLAENQCFIELRRCGEGDLIERIKTFGVVV